MASNNLNRHRRSVPEQPSGNYRRTKPLLDEALYTLDPDVRSAVMSDIQKGPGNRPPAPLSESVYENARNPNPEIGVGGRVPQTSGPYSAGVGKHQQQSSSPKIGSNIGGGGKGGGGVDSTKNESDLLGVMCQRLKALEKQIGIYKLELKTKNQKVIELEDRLRYEKQKHGEARTDRNELVVENAKLRHRVEDMEEFLSDYGLKWVGPEESSEEREEEEEDHSGGGQQMEQQRMEQPAAAGRQTDNDSGRPTVNQLEPAEGRQQQQQSQQKRFDLYEGAHNHEETTNVRHDIAVDTANLDQHETGPGEPNSSGPATPAWLKSPQKPRTGAPKKIPSANNIDMKLLQKQVDELNSSVTVTEVVNYGANGKTIKERQVVNFVVYSDGIVVNSGPFRPFGWPLCDAFIQDVLDGYYPYEFKDRYPDGFPLNLVDKASTPCPRGKAGAAGGTTTGSGGRRVVSLVDGAGGAEQPPSGEYKELTREELMQRLPKQVVTKSGKLVDVQGGVSALLGPSRAEAVAQMKEAKLEQAQGCSHVVSFDGATLIVNTPAYQSAAGSSDRGGTNAELRVKHPGGTTVVIAVHETETVGDVHEHIVKVLPHLVDGKGNSPSEEQHTAASFRLSTAFPNVVYQDLGTTVKAAGLAPQASMFLRFL